MNSRLGFSLPFCIAYSFQDYIDFKYFTQAADEGIGPHLWNVVGGIGIIMFGLVLLFPSFRFLRRATYEVLKCSFGMGVLSFGLLLGRMLFAIGPSTFIKEWQVWAFGISLTFLLMVVVVLTFAVYFFGNLIYNENSNTPFLVLFKTKEKSFRLLVGLAWVAVGIYALLIKHYSNA